MSSFSANWAALMAGQGWLIAIIVLVLLAALVWLRKSASSNTEKKHWAADDTQGFAPTVLVDSTEVSSWRAASQGDMPPPRPAGPIRVVNRTTMPVPLSENRGSS